MSDDGGFDQEEWNARLDAMSAVPEVIALLGRFDAASDSDAEGLRALLSKSGKPSGAAVFELAGECGAGLAAEGPADDLGVERAERLREPGRRLGYAGYWIARVLLCGDTPPAVLGEDDADAIEDLVGDFDWNLLVNDVTGQIGEDMLESEIADLGEDPEGAAMSALAMAFDQGMAFAFCEQLYLSD